MPLRKSKLNPKAIMVLKWFYRLPLAFVYFSELTPCFLEESIDINPFPHSVAHKQQFKKLVTDRFDLNIILVAIFMSFFMSLQMPQGN